MTALTSPDTRRLLARVYLWALTFTAAIAIAVALAFAPEVRAELRWTFPGVPGTFATAASIFATNAMKLIGVWGATLIVQAPWIGVQASAVRPGRAARTARLLCDVVGIYSATRNLLMLGLGLGAYGERLALATLPHGPIELLAFSLSAVLYLRARRGPLPAGVARPLVICSALALAAAALLETFVAS
jgi:hypothetical protein